MTEHNTLTDPALHEPKGASSATAGQIYVSDGSGSGVWTTVKSGWAFYKDNSAEQTFNTTAAKLSVDGAASTTSEDFLPLDIRGSGSLWDVTADKVTPIAEGDAYELRIDLPVTSRTSAVYATVSLDIGGGASPSIQIVKRRVEVDRAPPFDISIAIPFFCGSTFLANGGQLFVETDVGSIGVTAPAVFLSRVHGEVI